MKRIEVVQVRACDLDATMVIRRQGSSRHAASCRSQDDWVPIHGVWDGGAVEIDEVAKGCGATERHPWPFDNVSHDSLGPLHYDDVVVVTTVPDRHTGAAPDSREFHIRRIHWLDLVDIQVVREEE